MVLEQSNRLLTQLESELEEISYRTLCPMERLTAALRPIEIALGKLRLYFDAFAEVKSEDEICFFKRIKPLFYQWKIYFHKLYTIERDLPFGDLEIQEGYLEGELVYVRRFFRENSFYEDYYRRGAVELDQLYFLRSSLGSSSQLLPPMPELEPDFSTPMDYMFAKLMAFDRLREWLVERLTFLREGQHVGVGEQEIRWTGDSINLAEIALGLYHTKQLNHGSLSMGAISRWLEERFHVSIGVPSKRVSEIKRRTKFDKMRFLSGMREECLRVFEKEDEGYNLPSRDYSLDR